MPSFLAPLCPFPLVENNLTSYRPGLPFVSFHAYKEFKAKNRTQGYTAALLISQSF